jgi:hypothetical protein
LQRLQKNAALQLSELQLLAATSGSGVYLPLYPAVDIDASCMDMPKLEANQSCMQHRQAILIHLTRWIPIS